MQSIVKCLDSTPMDHSHEGSITISCRQRSPLRVYRFSKREQLPRKSPFTQGSNPQNERYEDYPLSIWREGPSPPNDNEIAERYLHQA